LLIQLQHRKGQGIFAHWQNRLAKHNVEKLGGTIGETIMDVVELPVLPIEASLDKAFDAMKEADRSAIVAVDSTRYWLFKAGWVVLGIARGEKVLADLEKRRRVHLASPVEAAQKKIDLMSPTKTPIAVEQFLDTVHRSYLLTDPVLRTSPLHGPMIKIITRHEGLAIEVGSGPTACYCTNPAVADDPHGYDQPLPFNNKCTLDGWDIVCS
jgi:hypothetical protein